MMKVVKIRNAKWLNQECTSFDCEILFEEFPEEWMPFTFNENDKESHSVWIKEQWLLENSQSVSEYTPPTEEQLLQQKSNEVVLRRNLILEESDKYVFPDRWYTYSEETRQLWSNYRQSLRDIPLQEGFPFDVTWPLSPLGV